uniref:Uncharacterized protein n=1 Tax=Branchiostoma floridae TaxID=7739 RepID=C3YVR3_BRAFL|eukprot:XP_002599585.1 hypothetical protein BRAFLDRAFT_77685 [Branchiostoma floridae]
MARNPNPTYAASDGDPDWSMGILRTKDLSTLYTGNNPTSGTGSSNIQQDEIPSLIVPKEPVTYMDTDGQHMDTEQEYKDGAQSKTSNVHTDGTSDTYEQHAQDEHSHSYVFDHIKLCSGIANPTYTASDGDPDWSTNILRTKDLSTLYTGNNPASGMAGSSSIQQDETPSRIIPKEPHTDTDDQDMGTKQEYQVRAQTLNCKTDGTSDTGEQPAQYENSHVYVFDDIEPYAITYKSRDETSRGEASSGAPGPLQNIISGTDVSDEPSAGSTFVANRRSEDNRDGSDDNGSRTLQNRRKGNADVQKLRIAPGDLLVNPMYGTSGHRQAINGSVVIASSAKNTPSTLLRTDGPVVIASSARTTPSNLHATDGPAEEPRTTPSIPQTTDGKGTRWTKKRIMTFTFGDSVNRMFVSPNNEIFVASRGKKRVLVLNMTGDFLLDFSTGRMGPYDVSMDRKGYLWVLLYNCYRRSSSQHFCRFASQQFSKQGDAFDRFDLPFESIKGYYPEIAVHPLTDNIMVAKWDSPARGLWLFRPNGTLVRTSETMESPSSLTVGKEGHIFVVCVIGSEYPSDLIYKYDMYGRYITKIGRSAGLYRPMDICVDSVGRLIVADFATDQSTQPWQLQWPTVKPHQ